MLNMMRIRSKWGALLLGVLAALLFAGSGTAQAAAVAFDLYAKAGTTATLPTRIGGAVSQPFWGYVGTDRRHAHGARRSDADRQSGRRRDGESAQQTPAKPPALLFQGQAIVPDTTGVAAGAGNRRRYTFTAGSPGHLPVRSRRCSRTRSTRRRWACTARWSCGPHGMSRCQAYGDPRRPTVRRRGGAGPQRDRPGARRQPGRLRHAQLRAEVLPDQRQGLSRHRPDHRHAAGNKLLLRYVNAGVQHHSMASAGPAADVRGQGRQPASDVNHNVVAEPLAPGQTGDAIATIPAATAAGSKFAVYDGSLMLHNNGGAGHRRHAHVRQRGNAGDRRRHDRPVDERAGADRRIRPTGAWMSRSPPRSASDDRRRERHRRGVLHRCYRRERHGNAHERVVRFADGCRHATILAATLASLASGKHTHLRARTGRGRQLGRVQRRDPEPRQGGPGHQRPDADAQSEQRHGGRRAARHGQRHHDRRIAHRGSGVLHRSAAVPTGSGTAMTVNVAAPVASLDVTIPAPVTARRHLRPQPGCDGQLGRLRDDHAQRGRRPVLSPPASAAHPPRTTARSAAELEQSGRAGHGEHDQLGIHGRRRRGLHRHGCGRHTAGTGFPFVPSDGAFNSATETGYADIPLATINALSAGNHTIYVRGKDAAGNWGATARDLPDRQDGADVHRHVTLRRAEPDVRRRRGDADGQRRRGSAGRWPCQRCRRRRVLDRHGRACPRHRDALHRSRAQHSRSARWPRASTRSACASATLRATGAPTSRTSATVNVVPDAIFANGFDAGRTQRRGVGRARRRIRRHG